MRFVAGITLVLCLAAPMFAQTVPRPQSAREVAALTPAEMSAFRRQVAACWQVDPGAGWAQTSVTITMSMTQEGKVVPSSLRMVASEGGDSATADAAFGAAKRAVLRCGRDGYSLPVEKYEKWRDIELTFTPERTSLK